MGGGPRERDASISVKLLSVDIIRVRVLVGHLPHKLLQHAALVVRGLVGGHQDVPLALRLEPAWLDHVGDKVCALVLGVGQGWGSGIAGSSCGQNVMKVSCEVSPIRIEIGVRSKK